ncbi:DUF4199 domain-containing protein [Flavobacterium sp. NRK F10]|uniref:DUF4199 domain-containing protein n=1 Tax=Flavobacterium sediminis TaxID=2201181 RepID=A0A2U8QSP7_9FLAO|nr:MULTISPECIES: DUF4199 domain-containing protein [Flavobacterium]AWM12854.1 DUF4199 domain-containing protein [Flavobacterium sediminis]MCO6173988.1 DUF4199 domain-containing protein [Flavobacterium sp. NRK F10]
MEQTISPSKSAVNYAIVFGIVMILEFVIMYAFNLSAQTNPTIGVIINVLNYLILPFTFIYLAANDFKNKINNGYISFGQTLKVGLSLCALAAVIYGIFYFIFDFIFPEFKTEVISQIQEITVKQNPNMTADQLKMSMKFVEMFMKPYVAIPFSIVMYSVIGLIHSLIVGAIVKKDKPAF